MSKRKIKIVTLMLAMIGLSVFMPGCDEDKGNPPTITTGDISQIADISATGSGKITNTGGGQIIALGLCYSTTNTTPTTSDSYVATGTYTVNGIVEDEWDFTATITGLTPVTKYYVRAYAANEAGVSYGEVKEFTTKAGKTFHTLTPSMLYTFTQEIWEGPKESLVDNNFNTFWHSAWSDDPGAEVFPLPHFIQITFNEPKGIGGIQYWHRTPSGTSGRPNSFDLQTSTNGTDWTTVWTSATNLPINIMPPSANTLSLDRNYTSKYFRIRILTNPGMTTYTYLSEIKVYHDGLLD